MNCRIKRLDPCPNAVQIALRNEWTWQIWQTPSSTQAASVAVEKVGPSKARHLFHTIKSVHVEIGNSTQFIPGKHLPIFQASDIVFRGTMEEDIQAVWSVGGLHEVTSK